MANYYRLLTLLIIVISFNTKAQERIIVNNTDVNSVENGAYISVNFKYKHKSLKLLIDYGQHNHHWKKRVAKDEFGNVLKIYSKVHAFNVLADNGWVYIDKYAFILGRDSATNNFLFKKLN